MKTEQAAALIAEKLGLVMAAPIAWNEHTITASMAIAAAMGFHGAGEDAEAFLSRADHAMHEAKSSGRNRVAAQ